MADKHPDDEIDNIIWSEIESSTSRGDFICYVVHSPVNAKYLEQAKKHIEREISVEDMVPVRYANAIRRIEELANQDHATAAFHMGKIHAMGIGVQQNLPEGIRWYSRAMELGEPRAYANMGWFYESGFGVTRDLVKAFELLSHAAEHGVLSAKAAVGLMLIKGNGVAVDTPAGLAKLEQAFKSGYINAGNHLSDLYFEGTHVPKDVELGHQWLWNVVNEGDERTMAILGHYLITGSHGKRDTEAGLALMQQAISLKFLPAYLWLGTLYKNGQGLEQDIGRALRLFRDGVAAGNNDCKKAISMLLAEHNAAEPGKPPVIH